MEKMEVANSTEKVVNLQQEEEDDDEEEALSLCDLPMIHNSRKEKDEEKSTSNIPLRAINDIQEDFDFCSLSKESEMCAADEVFFQGQILPLRHSVSSEKGLLQYCGSGSISRSISRSESMDYYSSRSSSISSSHQSSSSGSSSAATHPKPHHKRPKPPQNHFHSHPSPSPRLNSSNRQGNVNSNNRNCTKKTSSALWNIFRLGLVTPPPGIALQDLKTRCPTTNSTNCKNFGSRNSTGSNTSSLSSSGNQISPSPDKKKKPRGFLGGCMCTNDAVDTVSSKVAQIKKSASESEIQAPRIEDETENVEPMKPQEQQGAKKQLSHHRTFEWLKQLSIEGPADEA